MSEHTPIAESKREQAVRELGSLGLQAVRANRAYQDVFERQVSAWQAFEGVAIPIVAAVLEVHDTVKHTRDPFVRVDESGQNTSFLPPERYVVAEIVVDHPNLGLKVYVRHETDIAGRYLYDIDLAQVYLAPDVDSKIIATQAAAELNGPPDSSVPDVF